MLNPEDGLHRIKDQLTKQSQMMKYCMELAQCLRQAIAATHRQAPVRSKNYLVGHSTRGSITPPTREWHEKHWEEAIYRQYSEADTKWLSSPKAWMRIVDYQTPLKRARTDKGWGKIDLLGMDDKARPVVIELKRSVSTELPVRALVEAIAYGTVFRKAWRAGKLRREWCRQVKCEEVGCSLDTVALAVIAPSEYWTWCYSRPKIRDCWRPMIDVVERASSCGFPTQFCEIQYDAKKSRVERDRLPTVNGFRVFSCISEFE